MPNTETPTGQLDRSSDADATVAPGRWSTAGAVLVRAVQVGLIGGVTSGWVQAALPGWRYRSTLMGLREWGDVLSYSGLAHGILCAAQGAIVGTVLLLVVLVSRRVRQGIVPGAAALAVLLAGTTGFAIWPAAAEAGVAMARGLDQTWVPLMVAYWLLAAAGVYAVAHVLARTWIGQAGRSIVRVGFLPAVGVLLICLVVQWLERPRLMAPTTRWQEQAGRPSERRDPRPNVVLVVIDTQRADRLGCYGYSRPTSPRLDALAADAVVFEDCISPAIWTLPAHASIFTGLFPSEHGANWNHQWVDGKLTTMAKVLQQAGYQTVAFSNNVYVSPLTNLARGFDWFVQPWLLHRSRGNSVFGFLAHALYPAGHVGKWLGTLTAQDDGSKLTNQLAARWLDHRDRDRPFFLFINYMEPHDPYHPHLPHRELFIEPNDIGPSYRHAWWPGRFEFSLLKRDCYTPKELELLNQTYDAETRLQDDYVGQLLEILAERIPLDETLLIVTADHGENLGDYHMIGHAWCVYDTLAHVPLIVRYPKRLRPGRTNELVQTTDLLPTVMDAVNGGPIATPSTFGRSLLPPPGTSSGASTTASAPASSPATQPEARAAVTERMAAYDTGLDKAQAADRRFDRTPFEGVLRAIRQGPWKYIVAEDGREELYNLAADPHETNNLINKCRPVARQLAERLGEWLTRRKPYQGSPTLDGAQRLDDESRRRLRALGYL